MSLIYDLLVALMLVLAVFCSILAIGLIRFIYNEVMFQIELRDLRDVYSPFEKLNKNRK